MGADAMISLGAVHSRQVPCLGGYDSASEYCGGTSIADVSVQWCLEGSIIWAGIICFRHTERMLWRAAR